MRFDKMMRITFGLLLDGEEGWRPTNRLGLPVLGPLGLLNLLETRLGLLRTECAQTQRVTQYRECLKRCDTHDRFYHASFGIDPIGVSASLLSWRDAWYLRGWNPRWLAPLIQHLVENAPITHTCRAESRRNAAQRLGLPPYLAVTTLQLNAYASRSKPLNIDKSRCIIPMVFRAYPQNHPDFKPRLQIGAGTP